MFDAATAAVEGALAAGARYADARVVHRRYESMAAKNGDIETLVQGESFGVGLRALVGSSWGFQSVAEPDGAAAGRAGAGAAGPATAAAAVPGTAADQGAGRARPARRARGDELCRRAGACANTTRRVAAG